MGIAVATTALVSAVGLLASGTLDADPAAPVDAGTVAAAIDATDMDALATDTAIPRDAEELDAAISARWYCTTGSDDRGGTCESTRDACEAFRAGSDACAPSEVAYCFQYASKLSCARSLQQCNALQALSPKGTLCTQFTPEPQAAGSAIAQVAVYDVRFYAEPSIFAAATNGTNDGQLLARSMIGALLARVAAGGHPSLRMHVGAGLFWSALQNGQLGVAAEVVTDYPVLRWLRAGVHLGADRYGSYSAGTLLTFGGRVYVVDMLWLAVDVYAFTKPQPCTYFGTTGTLLGGGLSF